MAQMKNDRIKDGKRVIDLSVGPPTYRPRGILWKPRRKPRIAELYLRISDTKELRKRRRLVSEKVRRHADPQTESLLYSGPRTAWPTCLAVVDPGDVGLSRIPLSHIQRRSAPGGRGALLMPQKKKNGYIVDLKAITEDVAAERNSCCFLPNNRSPASRPLFYGSW
jgi:hypothetical protein